MINIPNYSILSQIYESINSLVYRAIHISDKQPVILKLLKEDYPTPSELTRYKQEYKITCNLNIEGVIKAYSLETYERTLAIVLEDFGASSLRKVMNNRDCVSCSLEEFLTIAIKTTEILGQIHTANIIHKDINPSNIIFNPATRQLKIIDFGISTQLTRENPTLKNPNVLEGTLAYISPEQTGRMNRSLDYRADFYSLGVTFYELLTGQLPFETDDPLELVHCHIAKIPISPHQINPKIPTILSNIVMKMMAKTAEERYQSAWGIKADLEECQTQLQTTGNISYFPLAAKDISDKFQIPQKLYGRAREVATLLTAFERIAGESQKSKLKIKKRYEEEFSYQVSQPKSQIEMMLVTGYSGIGKSVLVQELYKPITEKRGYFISGKFDQLQRNIPYSAVVNAFKELVRQLLTESESQLQRWRNKLLAAFGSNGQVIIDVIPEVELIVGKQPLVPDIGPAESQNRFNLVFQNFIRAFCTKEHPLVIFLDDLQWADSATLKLIELMMTNVDTQYLFLIGAYRDNEVNSAHPLTITLDGLQKEGVTINYITLAPLALESVSQLIADTLHRDTSSVNALAKLVVKKTNGNPFFINEFLKTLYAENLITFDFVRHVWQWNLDQIEAIEIANNVVDLMIDKLKKLPKSTQQVLRLAACIGASFDLNTLSIICEKAKEAIYPALVKAVQAGLILPTSELDEQLLIQNYKFGHDRIQQAAYALIDDDRKKAVHLQIGRLLLANLSPQSRAEKIFNIVDHLNLGRELIADEQELVNLARLNLEAGKKAKDSTAYTAALVQYFTPGIEVLLPDSWKTHYDLTFALYREKSECEYLCRNFEKAEESFDLILDRAKSKFDRAEIHNIRMVLYENSGNYIKAISIGIKALKSFGLSWQLNKKSEILSLIDEELLLYRANLERINIADLINAPEVVNPEIRVCIRLLMNMMGSAFFSDQDLLAAIALKIVNLAIEYGNSQETCYGYAVWGMLAGHILIDDETGYGFGQLAMNLTEQFNNLNLVCKVFNVFGGHISPWRSHLKKSIPILRKGYLAGVETGEVTVSYNSYNLIIQRILVADSFGNIIEESNKHIDFLKQIKSHIFVQVQQLYQHFLFNLQGLTADKFSLSDDEFDEFQCLRIWQENNFLTGVAPYNIFKTQIFFLYGDYEKALERAIQTEESIVFIAGMPIQTEYYFYYSLVLTAIYTTATAWEQQEYREILEANQQKMKIWADNCPENFLHKYLLMEAEIARISGKEIEVIWDLYDRAISSAHENEFIQNEALANELAAKFWLAKGKEEIAQLYMKKAHYGYQLWGAKRKVEDLEEKYQQLLPKSSAVSRAISIEKTITTTDSQSGETLDLATFIKATQAISSEIMLDKLLAALMKILIQNAGAQIGYLILQNEGKLQIEASGEVDSDNIAILESISIQNRLPEAIINYVVRTKETVVLNDATREGNFINDPYIKQHQAKSILCAPLLDRSRLIGIIYLENNLTKGAFTPTRLSVLQLLSGQAAISIENARLYQSLEDKVKQRTAQLAKANQEITALNELLKQENFRMRAELEVTKQLQQMILPKQSELESIAELEIAGFMEPADEVGGDYYDVLQRDGKIKIGIGDVTGHGLESGVLMLMTQTAVRTLQESNCADPVQFLDILNRTIYHNAQRINPYRNLTLTLIDYADRTLKISGQHEEIIIVRANGELELIDTRHLGFPIALEEDIADFIDCEEVQLNIGDVVVLYTDGVTEAFDIDRHQYGLERLCGIAQRNHSLSAEEIRQAIVEDVRQHIGSQKVFDDITLVVIKQK